MLPHVRISSLLPTCTSTDLCVIRLQNQMAVGFAMRCMPLDRKKRCEAAESLCSGLPIPTQVVASDEFMPVPQTERQRTVERGLLEIADTVSPRHGQIGRAACRERVCQYV